VSKLRQNFATRSTRDVKFRIKQLNGLQRMLDQHENLFIEAMQRDLHKPPHETILCEMLLVRNDIKMFKSNLHKWAAPQHVFRNIASLFDSAFVQPEPYGVALIISAWNYPIFLGLRPMIGAIAAGNCVILKPSEISPNIAKVLQDLLPRYIDSVSETNPFSPNPNEDNLAAFT
jgi:acyl-CoA reductase-like NAD-dependent aldehyde dehydrogenase